MTYTFHGYKGVLARVGLLTFINASDALKAFQGGEPVEKSPKYRSHQPNIKDNVFVELYDIYEENQVGTVNYLSCLA